MGRPSDKEIITKLKKIRDNAKKTNNFKVAMKFEIRIKEFQKKKRKKNKGLDTWIKF